MRVQKNQFFFGLGLTRAGTGTPDIANLMAIADLFQISVDELLSNEKSEKKQSNYIYESRTGLMTFQMPKQTITLSSMV